MEGAVTPNFIKNARHRVRIEGYSSQGLGIARLEGRAVFVRGAARGDLVDIKLHKVAKNALWAGIEEIIEPSPHRVRPECPYFPRCGGCDFWHITYEEELWLKGRRVADAMERIAGIKALPEEVLPDPLQRHYRNKSVMPVGLGPKGAVTGFYRARSHDLVPVERCLIHHPVCDTIAAVVRRWIDRTGTPVYDEGTGRGLVRQLMVRTAHDGSAHVCLVAAGETLPRAALLVEMLREMVPGLVGLALNGNTARGNAVMGSRTVTLWGDEALTDRLLGATLRLSPTAFYQVNRPQAERLYTMAAHYAALSGNERLVDLYCGAGSIALSLAGKTMEVYGVERVAAAVQNARENARLSGIQNAEFLCMDAAEGLAALFGRGIVPDVIVVDPPRAGLSQECVQTLLEGNAPKIVYVSCDPATLARDIALMKENYSLERLGCVDMFPKTANIESVALLTRRGG